MERAIYIDLRQYTEAYNVIRKKMFDDPKDYIECIENYLDVESMSSLDWYSHNIIVYRLIAAAICTTRSAIKRVSTL